MTNSRQKSVNVSKLTDADIKAKKLASLTDAVKKSELELLAVIQASLEKN